MSLVLDLRVLMAQATVYSAIGLWDEVRHIVHEVEKTTIDLGWKHYFEGKGTPPLLISDNAHLEKWWYEGWYEAKTKADEDSDRFVCYSEWYGA